MRTKPANINAAWADLVVEELIRNGITTFCISPGSRSTPLTLAAAQAPAARCIVHFDERGAAYYALGYARATGRPAALICTSGTAAANYLPAVVEASNAGVPMLLLTADRPPELLETGANQAIDQNRLFGDYTRWHFNFPCPSTSVSPEMVLTTVDQAVYQASRAPAGPVHLNCPFREPLAPTPDGIDMEAYLAPLARWRGEETPYTEYAPSVSAACTETLDAVAAAVDMTQRGLLIVGQLSRESDTEAVRVLAETLGWPVFPDVTSGLRLGGCAQAVPYYDQMLLSDGYREWCAPGTVLHVGGPVTSKRLAQHLAACRPQTYIRVADHPRRLDPDHGVTLRIESDLAAFCNALTPAISRLGDTAWLERHISLSQAVDLAVEAFLSGQTRLSEPGVARLVSRGVPEGAALFLGNSMPIRDMDMYAARDGAPLPVYANRGASGIDGNLATATGIAEGLGCPVVAVVGDLAALHDLNSLALLKNTSAPVILVVINNDGGGIFHFLPVADQKEAFEPFFATPHHMEFSGAAQMFGLKYAQVNSPEAFKAAVAGAQDTGASSIIEVSSQREENARTHAALQSEIITALNKAF